MVDLLQVLEGLAYVGFIAGAIFAVFELRGMRNERRMEIMMRASEHTNTREFEDAMAKLWRSSAADAKELEKQVTYVDICMIADFFEKLAWMGKKGIIDGKIVAEYYPFPYLWAKLQPWVQQERVSNSMPTMYDELETFARLSEALNPDFKRQ